MASNQFQQGQEQAIQLYQLYTNTSTPSKANIEAYKQYNNQKRYAAFNTLDPALVKRIERSTYKMEEYFESYYWPLAHARIMSSFLYDNLCLQTQYEQACGQLKEIKLLNILTLYSWTLNIFFNVSILHKILNYMSNVLSFCLPTQLILIKSLYVNHPQQIVTPMAFFNLSPLSELVLMLPDSVMIFLKHVDLLFLAIIKLSWIAQLSLLGFIIQQFVVFRMIKHYNVFVYEKKKKVVEDKLPRMGRPFQKLRRVSKLKQWLRRITNKGFSSKENV